MSNSVEIRPFPYPYKAGFAFCNDLDGLTSFDQMKAMHDVLNGTGDTPCGPGLGMEVGDSFHFYSVHPQQDDSFSYFDTLGGKPSSAAAPIREGITSGLLDTMHTWGNYSQRGGFFRKQAEKAFEEFEKRSLKVPVWTNHGDIHNFQNVGRKDSLGDVPEHRSARGDTSEVLEYHFDLARKLGIRYVWIKELTDIIGQERPLEPADWLESGVSLGKGLARNLIRMTGRSEGDHPVQLNNRLIDLHTFRDKSIRYQMLRYGRFDQDGSDHLPGLLTPKILRRLVDSSGAMMFYTHLAKGRPSSEVPFSKESYEALVRLARWNRDGDVWVTTPSKLCQYVELRHRLKLMVDMSAAPINITGHFALVRDLDFPDIAGLTIYLDTNSAVSLKIEGKEVPLIKNEPDHTSRSSFSVPLQPLEYCWG